MLGWFRALMPKEERFFELFTRHAQVNAVRRRGGDVVRCCNEVNAREEEADTVTRDVLMRRVHYGSRSRHRSMLGTRYSRWVRVAVRHAGAMFKVGVTAAFPRNSALTKKPKAISRGRSGRGSSPCSTQLRSLSRTSPSSRRSRRLPRGRAVASATRRSGQRACRST
jgi:hypothetical protein